MDEIVCKHPTCDGEFHSDNGKLSPCPIRYANRQSELLNLTRFKLSDMDMSNFDDSKILDKVSGFLSEKYLQLIIRGENGRGKTHIAKGILIEFLKRLKRVMIVTSAELIRTAADMYSDGAERADARFKIKDWRTVYALLLDDFGTRPYTQHALTILQDLIDTRVDRGLKTIYTTNLKDNNIRVSVQSREEAGEWVGRIASRMKERCLDVSVTGGDYRGKR